MERLLDISFGQRTANNSAGSGDEGVSGSLCSDDQVDSQLLLLNVASATTLDTLLEHPSPPTEEVSILALRESSRQIGRDGSQQTKIGAVGLHSVVKKPHGSLMDASGDAASSGDEGVSGSLCSDDQVDSHLELLNVSSGTMLDTLLDQPSSAAEISNLPVRTTSRQELPYRNQRTKTGPNSTIKRLRACLKDATDDAACNLYFTKLLQAWGDRMWIFAIPILLMELRRDPVPALFFPALYGFCSGASTILFGPVMGEWVDHVSRLHAAKVTAICQNGIIGCAGILLAACIHFRDMLSDWQLYLCVAALMVLGFASNIFYAASVVILEKDWVAVLAGKDRTRLAGIISTIRRIELATNVLCPLVMAQVMTYAGKDVAALVIGLWSSLSIFAEYHSMRRTCLLAGESMLKTKQAKIRRKKPLLRKLCKSCYAIYEGWKVFGKNKVCTAGLAVAFLEATVLIFSGVTNSYAVQQGFSSTAVALLTGCDALTGILGTFVFPVLRKRLSLEKIGLSAMVFHFLCGSVCVSSNWLPGSPFDPTFLLRGGPDHAAENVFATSSLASFTTPASLSLGPTLNSSISVFNDFTNKQYLTRDWTSLIVFSVGLTVGRFAFWMIDLTGSQILLESIRDENRGTICAVHYALKKLLNRVKYVMALFLAWPQTFGFLIIASQIFSVMGYGFFVVYCRKMAVRKRRFVTGPPPDLSLNRKQTE